MSDIHIAQQRVKTRRTLAYAAAGYAFGGALLMAAGAMFAPDLARIEAALPIFLASLTPAGTLLGYFKGRDTP